MATVRVYNNEGMINVARENERSRNIKRVQSVQQRKQYKDEYTQKIAQNINVSRQNIQIQPDTQAQQRHVFKKQQERSAQIKKARKKTNKRKKILAKKYQKVIKRYKNTPWVLMYTAAAASFLGGFFTEFLIGYLFTIPASIFIAIYIRRAFSKKERREMSALIITATTIKNIPIISMLPASIFEVYVAQTKAREKMIKSKKKLKKLKIKN